MLTDKHPNKQSHTQTLLKAIPPHYATPNRADGKNVKQKAFSGDLLEPGLTENKLVPEKVNG